MMLEWGWDAAGPGQNESGLGEREARTELMRGVGSESLGPGEKQIQSKAPAPTQRSRAVLCSEASQRGVCRPAGKLRGASLQSIIAESGRRK